MKKKLFLICSILKKNEYIMKSKKKLKKEREEQKQKLQEWIKQMGGKVQKEKVKEKPKLEEFKNSPSIKSMPLSSGIFTQNLIRILETAHEYQEIAVIGTRSEGKT